MYQTSVYQTSVSLASDDNVPRSENIPGMEIKTNVPIQQLQFDFSYTLTTAKGLQNWAQDMSFRYVRK